MSARPSRNPASDVDPLRVRLSDPGDLAAAVPHLLGFRPSESVVLIGLGGRRGNRVGLTVRGDIPPPDLAGDLARMLVRSISSDQPTAVVVVLVSEAPDEAAGPLAVFRPDAGLPHRPLLHELTVALTAAALPVRDALLVRSGRWWSYDCPEPCCAPGRGTPLPGGVTALEAASVTAGQVVAADREALVARIARLDGPALAAMETVTWRVGDRHSKAALTDRDATARRSWTTVMRTVQRCRPGPAGGPLSDRDVARVLWALADIRVRDRALTLAVGDDAPAAEILWTECTRRGPAPLDAAPATLLAVSAWLRGDGAMANVALERALDSRPTYSFAQLLAQGLTACLPPAQLREMIAATAAEPDELWAAG
jgi:hypothetical protein